MSLTVTERAALKRALDRVETADDHRDEPHNCAHFLREAADILRVVLADTNNHKGRNMRLRELTR